MTDLQFGLLLVGAVAVAGVLIYNRLQERATRRDAERSFGSEHPDVLLGESGARREPTLEPVGQAAEDPPVQAPPRRTPPTGAAPDPGVDYVIALTGGTPEAIVEKWAGLSRRFGNRALLAEADSGTLYAGLQMVSRKGPVTEAELLEFRSQVETLAAAHAAAVAAPEMRVALEAAQALDRACGEVDVQIALHVVGIPQVTPEAGPFQFARRADGVTLLLDLPRTAEPAMCYQAMVRTARELAARHGGRIVDDNGQVLDERALAAIEAEVEVLRARLVDMGVEPGSELALRLFS